VKVPAHFFVVSHFVSFIIFFLCNLKLACCFSTTSTSTSTLAHRDRGRGRDRDDSSNYIDILASNTPLLDVRAPIEYDKGSFPNTHNIPLLNDKHRELIGTCYKEQGQDAAIVLGNDLVQGKLKEDLVQSWKKHVELYPNGYLYCARGGLRSHIVQEWLQEAGVNYPLIIGGYKAMRHSLLLDLEISLESLPIVLIGGRTCSGKTVALKQMSRYVDLEGLANHRGSTFGAIAQEEDQPAQQDFENYIIIEYLKHRHSSSTLPVFMEDEGNRIGKRTLPISMHSRMANDYPLIILETPLQDRIDLCISEYVQDPFKHFLLLNDDNEEEAHDRIRDTFLDAVGRMNNGLQKRLRGTHNEGLDVIGEFEKAFDLFRSTNASDVSGFNDPIQILLDDYYDPMYDYQMSKREGEVLFCGSMEEIVKWADEYTALS